MLFNLGQDFFASRSLGDDTSTEYQRIDGDPDATVVVCLPWLMPYRVALGLRMIPRNFLACYEMPRAIVSSEPDLSLQAIEMVATDAMRVVERARVQPDRLLVVGLSIGNAVATVLANRLGARLCSIASADRGDYTLWESPASRQIRERAEAKGYTLSDFTRAMRGYHTIENLENLAPGSRFVVSLQDELIPSARREGLVSAVHRVLPDAEVSYVDSGHFGTMIESVRRGLVEPREVRLARVSAA